MTSTQTIELPKSLGKFIFHYLRHRKRYLLGYVIIALVWSIDLSLSPYLLKLMIDVLATHAGNSILMRQAIFWPAAAYVGVKFVNNLNFRVYDTIGLRIYPEIKSEIINDMSAYLMGHSYAFFQNHYAGSLAKKIFDMANNIEDLIIIPNSIFYQEL